MTQTEALKLALEALEVVYVNQPSNHFAKTIAGVKKALSDTNNKQVSWPISGDAAKQIADKLCVSYEVVQLVAREITAIKEALAQPEQEPVAWRKFDGLKFDYIEHIPALTGMVDEEWKALYNTTPPQRTWVGLTDDERLEVVGIDCADDWFWEVCKTIEAKLKEKNT